MSDLQRMGATGTLANLAAEINAEHRPFVGTFRKTVEHGIRAGGLLVEAKDQCPHGTWLGWLQENFEGAPRTAQKYMRLYNHRDEVRVKTRDSAHLSMSGALKEIAAPRESTDEKSLEYHARKANEHLANVRQIPTGRIMAPPRVGPPDRGDGSMRTSPLRSSKKLGHKEGPRLHDAPALPSLRSGSLAYPDGADLIGSPFAALEPPQGLRRVATNA